MAGLTQLDLAVKVRRTPSDISRWENGARKSLPDRNTIIALAHALNLTISDTNRFLEAANFEIPLSEKGVDLANPAIKRIVDIIATTKMSSQRMKAFEKDICDFIDIWKEYQDLETNEDFEMRIKGYRLLLNEKFPIFVDGFRIRSLHSWGKSYKHRGFFHEAIQCYKQGLRTAERIGSLQWSAELELCLGDAFRELSDPSAREHYERAAKTFGENLKDKINNIRNRRKMASVDLMMGTATIGLDPLNIFKACEEEVQDLLRDKSMEETRQQILEERCHIFYFIGWAYSLMGLSKEDIDVRQEGLKLAHELKDEYLITQGYHYLGDDFDNIDEMDKAEENYKNALEHCEKIKTPRKDREKSSIYRGLGSTLAKRGLDGRMLKMLSRGA